MQYGIKEVLDLTILDFATKKPITFIEYASATTNENAAERLDVSGGRGNARLLSFDHSKTSNLQLTLPLVDLNTLALLAGQDLITDTTSEIFKSEKLTVASGSVTLEKEPIDEVVVYKVEGLRDFGEEIGSLTATAKEVDLSSADPTVEEGEEVWVVYQYAAPAGAKEIRITSNNFPKAVEMHGKGLARKQEDELDYPVHVKVHKARPQANLTFTLNATEATNLEITFDMYEVTDENGNGRYIDYIFED